MHLGIVHHFGWAVAVTASADHVVIDRRRIELVEPGTPTAPIHHDGTHLADDAAAVLVAEVRESAVRATSVALDVLERALPASVASMSLRAWPPGFPAEIATQRRAPYEAQADSVMYRQVLAELACARGWRLHTYDAKVVEAGAARLLGVRTSEVLHGPRAVLGPPWGKDQRIALAAAVLASASS